jgi:hypothetical protein
MVKICFNENGTATLLYLSRFYAVAKEREMKNTKKTKIVNLTPHSIHELITGTVYPSEGLARCAVLSSDTGDRLNGVPVLEVEFGEVSGLPEPTPGVVYIVSQIVRSACPDRKDVVFPGELVRDENGQPVGCQGFRR